MEGIGTGQGGLFILDALGEADKQKMSTALNRLLLVNFLVKEKDRETYMLIRRNREAAQTFFRFLGWEFVMDERHECIYVQGPDSSMRRSLSREETLWMLILRLIYQEKREALSLSEFPMTTIYEIRTKYETFRIPWVNMTKLEKLVRLCARYQLLDAMDADLRSDDTRFRLFHSWIYLVNMDEVRAIAERIERYATKKEGDLLDEVDEEAASH
ncbi:DUF4194 domain-containing protein [Anoxybacillus rupiensis]|jgi:Domain of unknown function (DUF4194)|uniref:DUF4194 domain-containing protein n=1 Tax=Anoxybacteroides rupiense TaxID=311460 RepID=A0ABT5WAI8_9BACL|nr:MULTISPECIES: DUF4194 domain-containing protein [Anoxybacillus]MDE8565585.1 DUF4194 domain-containing protein [Anoxybacillus rupiensis]QHC03333.1 DUF4194 domain-containing protein [Anoxybacillus sp. PDR2]